MSEQPTYIVEKYEYLDIHHDDFAKGINQKQREGWALHSWRFASHWGNGGPYIIAVFRGRA